MDGWVSVWVCGWVSGWLVGWVSGWFLVGWVGGFWLGVWVFLVWLGGFCVCMSSWTDGRMDGYRWINGKIASERISYSKGLPKFLQNVNFWYISFDYVWISSLSILLYYIVKVVIMHKRLITNNSSLKMLVLQSSVIDRWQWLKRYSEKN